MSTNPFRQTRTQPEVDSSSGAIPTSSQGPSQSRRIVADGSGSKASELSVDTRVHPSLDRHVSFASPPVDSTIPAASYPSSPESTRFSPPAQFGQPATPNYRSAFFSDPFEDLGRDGGEDRTIQEAVTNAQNNASIGQSPVAKSREETVRDTLSRFAAAPKPSPLPPPQHNTSSYGGQQASAARQSLDVEAFKRLLLTGDSGQSTPGTATPPTHSRNRHDSSDQNTGLDTKSASQHSISNRPSQAADSYVKPYSVPDEDVIHGGKSKPPPPAPAPRRGKSVRVKAEPEGLTETEARQPVAPETTGKKPPAPPLARRQSQRIPSTKSEEVVIALSESSSPTGSINAGSKPPPPPPIRRQHSSTPRSPSIDLAITVEESNTLSAPSVGSRRSSNDRPPPPPPRALASSKRQSLGAMNPPPLPPPRRGRESSRSSIDSFRPSLASVSGEDAGHENVAPSHAPMADDESPNKTTSNANDILAELANLQREVEAARRGA